MKNKVGFVILLVIMMGVSYMTQVGIPYHGERMKLTTIGLCVGPSTRDADWIRKYNTSKDASVRGQAVVVVSRNTPHSRKAKKLFKKALSDSDPGVRADALRAFAVTQKTPEKILEVYRSDSDKSVRGTAYGILWRWDKEKM